MAETKRCTLCEEAKSIEEFGWHNRVKGRRRPKCKACRNAYLVEKWATDPEFRERANSRRNEKYANDREYRERAKARVKRDTCEDCGGPCTGKRCLECRVTWSRSLEGRRQHSEIMSRPEIRAKTRAANLGENNPSWRGGTSREPYVYDWNRVAESIRDRDGHRCLVCGAPEENGQAHDVHHKDYDKQNNDPSNLVTLCKKHHSQTTGGDRAYWRAYLTGVGYELYLGAC